MRSIILAIGVLFFVGPTLANPNICRNFEGAIYEGNKKGGGYQGPLKIKFDSQCKSSKNGFWIKYNWIIGERTIYTRGTLTFKGEDKVKYRQGGGSGSKGLVFVDGDKLHWKNVYTGNNYNVHVTKQQ